MDTRTAALLEVLRRLAGRLPDDTLTGLRLDLAEGRLAELEWNVLLHVRATGLRLTDEEVSRFPMIDLCQDDFPVESASAAATRPRPHFTPASATESDEAFLTLATRLPAPRRILKARRLPTSTHAERTLYLVEFPNSEDVSQRQADLTRPAGPHLLEAVREGENLPPYQADARAAAHQIWPPR